MNDKIEGRNPVMEALKSERQIDKIYVKKGEGQGSIIPILRKARERRIPIVEVNKAKLDSMSETGAHQGIIAQVGEFEYAEVEDILNAAKEKGEPPFIVVLDKINDPHNLGSIIRTANCAGAHGVIISKHDSVGVTATVAKSSAGAIEFTPVARVTNLVNAIEKLKDNGVWIVAADAKGEESMYDANLCGAMAVVIGSEGKGISRLLVEKCDYLVKIPMSGNVNSLNASVAAALMIYEIKRNREVK